MSYDFRLVGQSTLCAVTLSLATTGCMSIMHEERVGQPVRSEKAIETHVVGSPRMTLIPHDDGLGWTVVSETRVVRTRGYHEVQEWRGRRYVFSPLSLIPGIFQCPIGLVHLFNRNQTGNILRFGCARLAMFEPLDGATPLPATTASKVSTQTAWEPMQDGMIQLVWPEYPEQPVNYILSSDGRTDVRLPHLLSRLVVMDNPITSGQGQSVSVRLRYGDGSIIEQTVALSARQIQQAARTIRRPIASDEWPSPIIIQIRVESATVSPQEEALIREQLVRLMLQRRLCVVFEGLHQHLLDEQRVQYSGVVDSQFQVRLGTLLSPSVVLNVSSSLVEEGGRPVRHLTVQIRDVREGQIFGTAFGVSRFDSVGHAMERALTELDLLMSDAPRTGCPL
jgi:hypothetical protein